MVEAGAAHERAASANKAGMAGAMVVSIAGMLTFHHAGFGRALLVSIGGSVLGLLGTKKLMLKEAYGWGSAARDAGTGALMGAGMQVGMSLGDKLVGGLRIRNKIGRWILQWGGMLVGMAAGMRVAHHLRGSASAAPPTGQ